MVRRRYVVHGHVQGVFFRASTRQAAQRAGVTGWVRNEPDGSVVAEVQGDLEAIGAVESFLHTGPAGARVDRVERTDVDPVPDEAGFRITG